MVLQVEHSGAAYIFVAMLLLTLPADWIAACMFAASVHEICHILSVILMGGRVCSLNIGFSGAVINSAPMTAGRELICILAGPAGSLILMCFCKWIPKSALCGLVQGLFNLIPIYPLDGGRALFCILSMIISPERVEKWMVYISCIVLVAMVGLSLFFCFKLKLGFVPLLVSVVCLLKCFRENLLAKKGISEYNTFTI